MNKAQILDTIFEDFVKSYIKARTRAGISVLEMAEICLRAKEQLKNKKWLEWLEDNRINLKRTQAKKLIAVAKACKQQGQLTDLLSKKGIEETYLLTKISDDLIRENLAEQIIDADFTVKQTKQVVSKVKEDKLSPIEAVNEVKNIVLVTGKIKNRQTIPIEEYNRLKLEYEQLLKVKQQLEEKLKYKEGSIKEKTLQTKQEIIQDQILNEPVDSDEPDFTIDEVTHSIVFKGKKIPIPKNLNLLDQSETYLEIIATKGAKMFGLDLS